MELQLRSPQPHMAALRLIPQEHREYDTAALKQRMLTHLGDSAESYPSNIERKFPRILAQIVELWGKPALDRYLEGLMVSDRPHRQGFPGDVAVEIFRLSVLHGSLGVSKEPVPVGWASVSDGEIVKYFKKNG